MTKKENVITDKEFEMPEIAIFVFNNEAVITNCGLKFNLGNVEFPRFKPFGE